MLIVNILGIFMVTVGENYCLEIAGGGQADFRLALPLVLP